MIRNLILCFVLIFALHPFSAAHKKPSEKQQPLAEYLREASASTPSTAPTGSGSLFTTGGLLADPYSDFKARGVGDTVAIQIVESTTISQSGNLATQRSFSHTSGVTGVGGESPGFLNPLLAANSSTKLTGTGSAASQSSLNTILTAQVVAVLPSGSLVVEARRHVLANQQHENVILRGVVRPADISSANSVYSYQLFNLQLEVRGKGVISDTVRQPNIVMRTLLKLFSF
jgi:flagellar L-ring protein precursor FlgH